MFGDFQLSVTAELEAQAPSRKLGVICGLLALHEAGNAWCENSDAGALPVI